MTSGRILLVDDDEAIRTVVSEALRREGHMVVAAESVADQTRQLESFTPLDGGSRDRAGRFRVFAQAI